MILTAQEIVDRLALHAGMKVDQQVILGQEEIRKWILSHMQDFHFSVEPFADSQTLYGKNDHGHAVKVLFENHTLQRIVMATHLEHTQRQRMIIRYDGTDFSGFQRQKNVRSAQAELETILSSIQDRPTACLGASRTDRGVHATGQVAHFDTPTLMKPDRWLYILNRQLPKDISVCSIEVAPPLFHARYDAIKKSYRYRLNTGFYNPLDRHREWVVPELDLDILRTNLEELKGTHDFTSFSTGVKADMVRTIFDCDVIEKDGYLDLYFSGNGFLHHMVRLIVMQLVLLATREKTGSMTQIILERSRSSTRRMAPAGGLYLEKVWY